jgi:hypothetical protein
MSPAKEYGCIYTSSNTTTRNEFLWTIKGLIPHFHRTGIRYIYLSRWKELKKRNWTRRPTRFTSQLLLRRPPLLDIPPLWTPSIWPYRDILQKIERAPLPRCRTKSTRTAANGGTATFNTEHDAPCSGSRCHDLPCLWKRRKAQQ